MELDYLRRIGLLQAHVDTDIVAENGSCSLCHGRHVPDVASGHSGALTSEHTSKIPDQDKRVLRFLFAFLEKEGVGYVPLYINGGYVRDLLLNKIPDDLDISLCLRDCPETVTVSSLLEKVPEFASANPQLGIVEAKIATIVSSEAKNKQLDTFKAHFTDIEGNKIEVDVMPTIGEESYEEGNRIPVRDERGTPEQDALRRDLTIGALLLRVAPSAPSQPLSDLRYELLDFYGGVEDIERRILRAPFPADRTTAAVQSAVLHTPDEIQLAEASGIGRLSTAEATQVLWWAKILMDDPLRICRALRFAAKLGFSLHQAFWVAAPFALPALRSKVAGSRKNTEYQKIGGYGYHCCVEFFALAFSRTFGPEGTVYRLAPALFGGQDEKGKARCIADVNSFDSDCFFHLAECLKPVDNAAALTGGLLGVAIAVAHVKGSADALSEFSLACDGMCVSTAMRDAGQWALTAVARLSAVEPEPGRLEHAFAAACGLTSAQDMCIYLQVWNSLQFTGAAKDWPSAFKESFRKLAVAILQLSQPQKAGMLLTHVQTVSRQRQPVKGAVLGIKGVLDVPPQLRARVLACLEIALRLLQYDAPLDDEAQLHALLGEKPQLRLALSEQIWFEDDGKTLREEFQPPKKGKSAKKS